MILYRVDETWFGTANDAKAFARAQAEVRERDELTEVERVDVDTGKPAILELLNSGKPHGLMVLDSIQLLRGKKPTTAEA